MKFPEITDPAEKEKIKKEYLNMEQAAKVLGRFPYDFHFECLRHKYKGIVLVDDEFYIPQATIDEILEKRRKWSSSIIRDPASEFFRKRDKKEDPIFENNPTRFRKIKV